MSTAISPSPPPLLSRTQAIPRRRRHQPPSLPRQHPPTPSIPEPLQPPPCHPLHRPSHASRGTHRPLRRRRSHCAYFFLVFILFYFSYFSFHLELVQDSVGCNTAAAATSPRARTGYPVAVISPFWGTPAAPLHPPLRASRVHASHRRRSPYLVPPLKKKCKSFVPFTSNFPLAHTPRRLTNLSPQGHLDKFFFFFSSFSFSSRTGAGQRRSQHTTSPPSPPVARTKATLLAYHPITRATRATLPLHGPVTHATHRPRRAQPSRRRYPDYIASTSTQPLVAATTAATSIPPPRHPLWAHQPPRCTHPHTRRRHTSALPPSN